MKLTTDSIIDMLPIGDSLKQKLHIAVSSTDPDEKFKWENVVWDAYNTLYDIQYQYNYQAMLAQLATDKVPFNNSFVRLVTEKTEEDMEKLTYANIESSQLNAVRTKLQTLSLTGG